jgi:hypothetical protein
MVRQKQQSLWLKAQQEERTRLAQQVIECSLAENAIDHLLLAGEQAKTGTPRMLKHAVATLAEGIELLLKARLEGQHWHLLFKDVDAADHAKYLSGDFTSVLIDQAKKRLTSICGVKIRPDDAATIETLRKDRNKIRHFSISTKQETVWPVLAKTYEFALAFVKTELETVAKPTLHAEIAKLRTMLGEFQQFVTHRRAAIDEELKKHATVFPCPACLQETMVAGGGESRCLFCMYGDSGPGVAMQWALKHFDYDQLAAVVYAAECPSCHEGAFFPANDILEWDRWYCCFSCGLAGNYLCCQNCGNMFKDIDHNGICGPCRSEISGAAK